jgi:signal transduction histidine kinase
VVVTDIVGNVVLANDAARSLWQSLGSNGELRQVDHLLGQLRDSTGKPPLGPGTIWQNAPLSAAVSARDGRCFALACEPQRSADDAVIGAVVRIADTTETMRTQREREEVMQLLSHDMRSPQVSILTLLEGAPARKIEKRLAERIQDYAERTLHLADGFVQLSRAQSLRFEPQVIDISDVAREAIDALWPQASASGVKLLAELRDDELLVLGEGSLLSRMLVNLIDNAIRYSSAGQAVRIAVALERSDADPWCRITVADQGAGIPPEQLQQVFQRFQSSGTGSAQGKGGVGLGLAFVHATVLRHNGSITCDSSADQGTSFYIRIPVHLDDS